MQSLRTLQTGPLESSVKDEPLPIVLIISTGDYGELVYRSLCSASGKLLEDRDPV
jgi:hypothetical protein